MEIKRDIIEKLKAWKENPRRKPLVLQGARQVGKSWALKKFGKECFEDIVYINFDTMPALKEDFRRTKVPAQLIRQMEIMTGKPITPSSTLIILDEIQECNDALNSLKYFCEDAPEYHIIVAGSLLGGMLDTSAEEEKKSSGKKKTSSSGKKTTTSGKKKTTTGKKTTASGKKTTSSSGKKTASSGKKTATAKKPAKNEDDAAELLGSVLGSLLGGKK